MAVTHLNQTPIDANVGIDEAEWRADHVVTFTKDELNAAVTDDNVRFTSDTIAVADITDFDAAVAANSAVALNTTKVSNATHSGDATGATILTFATVNSNVGSFGLAGSVAQFVVNAKGLITSAVNVAISVAATAISDATTAGRAMLTAATSSAQTALLDVFTSGAKGLAPASGGGTSNYLRADGAWEAPEGGTSLGATVAISQGLGRT